jgi:predicted secreted hydrolase
MSADAAIRRLILGALLLLGAGPAAAQGFAGLGGDAGGFAEVRPGVRLEFPADHGPHPDYRIEWWYLTANLRDAAGAEYGAQWTLFRQALEPGPQREGWASQQLWMGHAAVTSAQRHLHHEIFARGGVGQAGVEVAPFNAWIDDWFLKTVGPTGADGLSPLQLAATGPDFSYALQLDTERPIVLQGDLGYSVKSDRGQASYYFSQPFFKVDGALVIEGETIEVTGAAWMDREWSSQPLAPDQEGWDWFSLRLDTGDKVMLYRLRYQDGRHDVAGNWISPEGRSAPFAPGAVEMTPTTYHAVAGRTVPTEWRIVIEDRGVDLRTAPLNPDSWMETSFPYWEGPIRFTGSHEGRGYLEMTGY